MKFRKIELGVGIACLVAGLGFIIADFLQNRKPSADEVVEDRVVSIPHQKFDFDEVRKGWTLHTFSKPTFLTTEIVIKKTERLSQVLKNHGVSTGDSASIIKALRPFYTSGDVRRGQRLFLQRKKNNGSPELKLEKILFITPPGIKYSLVPVNQKFQLEKAPDILPKKTQYIKGMIQDSLYIDGLKRGLSQHNINKLTKLYSFSTDLQRNLHRGDTFEVMIEKTYDPETGFVDPGSIVYSVLNLRTGPKRIYRYTIAKDKIEYINEKGEGVRKALLQTPVKGARISSPFSIRRHPILGYTKAHRGVDFAAHTGTPILAAGDGKIKKLGWLGSYGNYILVMHTPHYSTAYAHMSRYAKGLKNGTSIKQGQVIGYVGTTGRSTGPHLHYEVHYKGRQVNPHNLKLPSQTILKGAQLNAFLVYTNSLNGQIAQLKRNSPL